MLNLPEPAQVVVCEAHDAPGGAAHEFKVKDYSFDSGPSFFAGLSGSDIISCDMCCAQRSCDAIVMLPRHQS